MENVVEKVITKLNYELIFKKWIVGICRDNIKDIIRNKTFNPDIKWIAKTTFDNFYADPFHLNSENGTLKIIVEDFTIKDNYGKIGLLTFNENLQITKRKILLDTQSHLSYPFVFKENNKLYVFPEAKQSGKLSCYEFNFNSESLVFIKDILNLPLLDSTILKYNNKYWLFGTISKNKMDYNLHLFFSEHLLGPYTPHIQNPVKNGLYGSRSAGNFIEVDGNLYRPSQNCEEEYGKEIVINKVVELNEGEFREESYMTISIDGKNKNNRKVHTIHTINVLDDIILVDGVHRSFSPLKQFRKNHKNSKVITATMK